MSEFDIILLPSYAQAESWRKRYADLHPHGLFAQTVTTFDAWIADLWELHGDGRLIVGATQRQVFMRAILRDAGVGLDLPGVAPLAATCMRVAAGVPAFAKAIGQARAGEVPDGLSRQEANFLIALARYSDLLADLGLVELGEASALLAVDAGQVFPRSIQVLMAEAVPLSWIQRHFFSSCQQIALTMQNSSDVDGVKKAPEGVRVQFAYPSGRTAEPALVADIVLENVCEGDVTVVCKDPSDLCSRIEGRLAAEGLRACVQAGKPFAQTDFGRAFLALRRCLQSDPWDAAALTDVLISPFSGLSQADAFAIDEAVRADRLASRDDVLARLRASSELFSQLEELASDSEADVLIGAFEQLAQASAHRSATWRAEQLAAMGALREATSAARRAGAGIDLCDSVLQRATLPTSYRVEGEGPHVLFTTQAQAARLEAGCCSMLVIADLTSEDYPIADKDDAASTLLAKLALEPVESALSRARREFNALLDLPTSSLCIVRPLSDASAEDTHPAAVLEEFIDAYRFDSAEIGGIDNPNGLFADLQEGQIRRGEELLYANERGAQASARQPSVTEMPQPRLGDLGEMGGLSSDPPRYLSPSQVEVYLECPYEWFATCRLRIGGLDEGLGPLERGSFAHAALDTFYRRFQEAGHAKVNQENLVEARGLMRQVIDGLREAQCLEEPKSGRLVPVSELERREVDALCNQLVSFLDFEARLLPTFRPAYLEFGIDAERAIGYAGIPLVGRVDRIDVDGQGHAVIIDYKGSVNVEHEIAGKTVEHAGKVQTRVYARAVERALGLQVVGALYVSYGRNPALSGAYDPRVLEAAHLPGMRHSNCACGLSEQAPDSRPDGFAFGDLAFDRMLDATEDLVGSAVSAMRSGVVEPHPSYAHACEYCPVLACPKRGA